MSEFNQLISKLTDDHVDFDEAQEEINKIGVDNLMGDSPKNSILYEILLNNNINQDLVNQLIDIIPNQEFFIVDNEGNNILHLLLQDGKNDEVITYLIINVDGLVDVENDDGYTPIAYADEIYFEDVIQYMNEDILKDQINNKLILLRFSEFDDFQEYGYILSDNILPYVDDFSVQNKDGNTLLHFAIALLDVDTVRYIYNKMLDDGMNININIENDSGDTPLDLANKIMEDLVTELNDGGPNGDVENKLNDINNIIELFKPMVKSAFTGSGKNKIFEAIRNNDIDMINKLSDEDIQNNDDYTFLHLAIKNNLIEIVKILLDKLTDENLIIEDKDGNRPLHLAVMINNKEMVEILLERLSVEDLVIKDIFGGTPLHDSNNVEITEMLLNKLSNEDIVIQDDDGYTPLHNAVYYKNIETFQKILERLPKEAKTIKNKDGDTPLDLVNKKIEQYGETDIYIAMRSMLQPIVKSAYTGSGLFSDDLSYEDELIDLIGEGVIEDAMELLNSNIDIDLGYQDDFGYTALHIAGTRGYSEIVELLLKKMTQEQILLQDYEEGNDALQSIIEMDSIHIDLKTLELLLNNLTKERLESLNNNGDTILHSMLYYEGDDLRLDIIRLILDEAPYLKNIENGNGLLPIDIVNNMIRENGETDKLLEIKSLLTPKVKSAYTGS